MTFQEDDLFKKDKSFGATAGFVAGIDGSFPGKVPRDLSHLSQANFLFIINYQCKEQFSYSSPKHFYKNYLNIPKQNFTLPLKKTMKNSKQEAWAPQLKCLGARRAPQNVNLGDHLLGLGTQAKTLGSPKGSLKFSLEHSLGTSTGFEPMTWRYWCDGATN